MPNYDVFNGDADGICSLIQLRLADAKESILITGVKRDISLLKQVEAQEGDNISVLDISMDKNIDALNKVLAAGASVFYADHHRSGTIPESEKLQAYIDLSSSVCTALIVDKYLAGKFRAWAITAAFGDNLKKEGRELAIESGFTESEITQMDELGTIINYNGYGELSDLFYHPAELYKKMVKYKTPFEFIRQEPEVFNTLLEGYKSDSEKAEALEAYKLTESAALFILPDEQWARRVSGVYSNKLALDHPARAHAVLTEKEDGYLVSLRAPKSNPIGAVDIASQFSTGGGRAGAAGINHLPKNQLAKLFAVLSSFY
jgi:hypothetical protein